MKYVILTENPDDRILIKEKFVSCNFIPRLNDIIIHEKYRFKVVAVDYLIFKEYSLNDWLNTSLPQVYVERII